MESGLARGVTQEPTQLQRGALAICFGLSGMAALTYEVVWTRILSVVFGSTVYAVTMMLTAFMVGLSLGALWGGRTADRSNKPVFVLAMIEVGIAMLGLASLPALAATGRLYLSVLTSVDPAPAVFPVFQFGFAFLVMVLPTLLMGATFPVFTRLHLPADGRIGSHVGALYSANTVGSVLGAVGSGFFLVPSIGLTATVIFAASLNALAAGGVLVFLLPRRERTKRPQVQPEVDDSLV